MVFGTFFVYWYDLGNKPLFRYLFLIVNFGKKNEKWKFELIGSVYQDSLGDSVKTFTIFLL